MRKKLKSSTEENKPETISLNDDSVLDDSNLEDDALKPTLAGKATRFFKKKS